jgi:signal transduction histidine kinase
MSKREARAGRKPAAARKGSATFRPRARIIETLGRDLISNETIAIQELIKNAYDADASRVTITFEEPLTQGHGAIIIADNGEGMTLDTVRQSWMEPATVSKLRKTTTRKGRRVTGEKGIGRFAAARVARTLEMVTISRATKEQVTIRFDWGAFADQSRYLDEIKCSWEVQPAPSNRVHGTTLRLSELNNEWDEDEKRGLTSFRDLRAELARLVAPLGKDEFGIELNLPARFKAFAGAITPPEVLGKPHYMLSGQMDAEGKLTASYEGPNGKKTFTNGEKSVIRLQGGRLPACGPFAFEFRVWDRQKDDLDPLVKSLNSTLRDIRRDLDAASGISVYRDNFRVLIPESDWLRLDLRRVQNPTLRLSNNQIVARVFISADENRGLKDQTNRQGIVDSPQLEDFKAVLKEILSKLEVERDGYRRGNKPQPATSGVFEKLQIAPIRAYLVQRYPDDKDLREYIDKATQTHEQGIGEVQQVLARYRRLATLGQLIDVVLHEGRTPVAAIKNEVTLANREIEKGASEQLSERIAGRFKVIVEQADMLTLLFKRLTPFSGRRRGRPIQTTIEQLIKDSFGLYAQRLQESKVSVQLPDGATSVTTDPSEMQMIFVNLLDNSLYWLERVPEKDRRISVQMQPGPSALQIVFSDSGPGVTEDVRDRIFDPYFSTKPEGVGLGLTIAGETAAEYNGTLELLAAGPLPGATFRITLRNRAGVDDGQ